MKSNNTLSGRMKLYESVNRDYLVPNMSTIIRLYGKAFHSFTKGMKRPFDVKLMDAMSDTAKYLCKNIMGCKIAYIQSDEITLLLTDFDTINTEPWFNGNIQKMVSIAASMATAKFNELIDSQKLAMFDARVFQLPICEVVNNFIWRQQDAVRNSVQSVGQAYFSHKDLHRKSCSDIQDMLMTTYNVNWNDYPTSQRRGRCVIKEKFQHNGVERTHWITDNEIPIFTKDRNYIDKLMKFNKM